MKRTPAIVALSAAVFASLAACNGGGGSTSPAPSPTPAAAPVRTLSVQRSLTSQALTSISSNRLLYQFAGGGASIFSATNRRISAAAVRVTSAWRAGIAPQPHRARQADVTYSACSQFVESASVTVSDTEQQAYNRIYYDSACTQLWQDVFLDVIATGSGTANGTGTQTSYTTGGTQYDYETLAITIDFANGLGTELSLLATDAATSSSPQRATLGIACIFNTALNCGSGGVTHLASVPGDFGALLDEQISSTSSTPTSSGAVTTLPFSANASAYASGLNTLTLAPGSPFPAWAISGSTPLHAATMSGQINFSESNGALAGATLTVTDTADDGTVTTTTSGSPITIAGTVKQTSTGITVATFLVDANGNGTITYGDASTAQISNWVLIG